MGARARKASPLLQGAGAVAESLHTRGAPFAPSCRLAMVNGSIGIVAGPPGKPAGVIAMTIVRDRIVAFDLIGDPARLARGELER